MVTGGEGDGGRGSRVFAWAFSNVVGSVVVACGPNSAETLSGSHRWPTAYVGAAAAANAPSTRAFRTVWTRGGDLPGRPPARYFPAKPGA